MLTLLLPLSLASPTAVAVHKVGSCPSGYTTSGDYCLATSSESTDVEALVAIALPKKGSCPSGYTTSGDACRPTKIGRAHV